MLTVTMLNSYSTNMSTQFTVRELEGLSSKLYASGTGL
jgi:hypothetical protein